MKKYKVTVIETNAWDFIVEAQDASAAEAVIANKYASSLNWHIENLDNVNMDIGLVDYESEELK